jgi:hypothetical protein
MCVILIMNEIQSIFIKQEHSSLEESGYNET